VWRRLIPKEISAPQRGRHRGINTKHSTWFDAQGQLALGVVGLRHRNSDIVVR